MSSILNKEQFLKKYNINHEDFEKTQLNWAVLKEIYDDHIGKNEPLKLAAEYILQRLQEVSHVHSIKMRIKDAEHLIEKIIRKKKDNDKLVITLNNYPQCITDLIGLRALHLFKDEWRYIHEFITNNWDTHETPTANIRKGDSEKLTADFQKAGFNINYHKDGYRSIHYLIKFKPTKAPEYIAELQVRTIFEEGWSEIDHRIRYPHHSDDPYLHHFLIIFNRLSGHADEMGTFIKELSVHLHDQEKLLREREQRINQKEGELKEAISKLKITGEEKKKLAHEIELLSKSTSAPKISSLSDMLKASSAYSGYLGYPGYSSDQGGKYFPAGSTSICPKCHNTFIKTDLWSVADVSKKKDICPDCQKSDI